MSETKNKTLTLLIDKFDIKIFDKIEYTKKCATGIAIFTLFTALITFDNYRRNIYNNEKIIKKIKDENKIIESKIEELIETNKLIIKILEKHDERIDELIHYPFITFESKNSLQCSSLSLSELSSHSEKVNEDEDESHYLNYYCSESDEENKSIQSKESDKSNKISEHQCKKDIEDQELLNECYDVFPCNNSKKASGLNRLFGWN
jgi:hypothetical protein